MLKIKDIQRIVVSGTFLILWYTAIWWQTLFSTHIDHSIIIDCCFLFVECFWFVVGHLDLQGQSGGIGTGFMGWRYY